MSLMPPAPAHAAASNEPTQVTNEDTLPTRRIHARDEPDFPDFPVRAKKRRRDEPYAIYKAYGRHYGCMGDLFRDMHYTITCGLKHDEETPTEHLDAREQKHYGLFKFLTTIIPDLKARIAAGDDDFVILIALKMTEGRSELLQVLISGIKNSISDWDHFEPRLMKDRKEQRGYHHDQCGRLLCPIDLDWDDECVREGLRNYQYDRYPIDPEHHPQFLWQDGIVDQDNLTKGFGRSKLLLKAMAHVLLGPAAAVAIAADGSRYGANNRGRQVRENTKPRASQWGIKHITPGCIAACAVFVHFALSDQRNFSVGGETATRGTWPYRQFYHQIVYIIEQVMSAGERDDLLGWYTRSILLQSYDNEAGDLGVDKENQQPSPFARMVAQATGARATESCDREPLAGRDNI